MTLHQQVQDDLKTAMKAGDSIRVRALRSIRKEFIDIEKSGAGEVTDDKAIAALQKMKKQRLESIELYTQGNRPELAEEEVSEIKIIETYLPIMADADTISGWIQEAVSELMAQGISFNEGRVMGVVMKKHKGKVDSSLVQSLVKQALA